VAILRQLWPFGLVVGFALGLPLWNPQRSQAFFSGVYSYPSGGPSVLHSTLEPAFVSWVNPTAAQQIKVVMERAHSRRSLPLISLEPFADPAIPNGSSTLVEDVVQGRYNRWLAPLLAELCRPEQPVLLRFAHEMDHTNQYPWSVAQGDAYVRLYRAVWQQAQQPRCRRLHWVWSPAGNGDARPFWPGADAVDLIGISIYTSPRWNTDGQLHTFADIYDRRRWLHLQYRKPLLVAEMGLGGSLEQRRRWLLEARAAVARYPELIGWVYFNAPQPRWIPLATGHEDWSLPAAALALVTYPLERPSFHCMLIDVWFPNLRQQLCAANPPFSSARVNSATDTSSPAVASRKPTDSGR
jgi:hypothetical protein